MKKQGLFRSLILALTLAAGFGAVWGVVGVWAVQVGEHVVGFDRHEETLEFLQGGTARVSAHDFNERQYFDLDHHPAPLPNAGDFLGAGASLPATIPLKTHWGEWPWDQRVRAFMDRNTPPVYWYFLSDGRPYGLGYFVGYDSKTHMRVGFLGKAGFRPDPLNTEDMIPFGGDQSDQEARVFNMSFRGSAPDLRISQWRQEFPGFLTLADVYVFGCDGKLYHADLHKRTIRTVLDGSSIRSVTLGNDFPKPMILAPIVRTDEAVLVLGENDKVRARFPIPNALRDRDLEFLTTTTGEAVMYRHSPHDSLATEIDYQIYWLTRRGIDREAKVTLRWSGGAVDQPLFFGVEAPVPAFVLGSVAIQRPRELLENGMAATYGEALVQALREYQVSIATALLIAIMLGGLCYRRQVRYGASGVERLVWPLFVLMLGLPGWIGYRFGRSWPVLESCPTCHAAVPRDRADCVRCTAEFPGPVLKGTEVFA